MKPSEKNQKTFTKVNDSLRRISVQEITSTQKIFFAYIIGWQEKGQVQKEIENKIMRFLKTKLERDEAKSKAKEMLDVLIKNKDA